MGQARLKRQSGTPYDTQREARLRSGQQERDDMRQFLQEMLTWQDDDKLINRPQDDQGWARLVEYNLRGWRKGGNDQFSLWRKRRDKRCRSDLELRRQVCIMHNLTWHELSDEQKKVVRKMCATVGLPEGEWDEHLRGLL